MQVGVLTSWGRDWILVRIAQRSREGVSRTCLEDGGLRKTGNLWLRKVD